jgi:phosphoglucosamine mutase
VARLFGTDGVRGVANRELTGELAFRLGRAAVIAMAERGEIRPQIAVGRDTRASGEFLEAAIAAGICSAGGDALLLGVCTTPAVAFLTADLGAQAGAVISASHNPAEYNGIKFFGPTGYKVPDDVEDQIEAIVAKDPNEGPTGRGVGRIVHLPDARERYLHHLEACPTGSLEGMKVVVDCGHGASSGVAPELLRRRGAEVIAINDAPDGWNINDGGGATAPGGMALAVLDADADAGVAHDGDADRAIFADHLGRIVDGDEVLAACALDRHERDDLDGSVVVTTVMANLGFRLSMQAAGIEVIETKVGDRYVLEEMLRSGASLGGEQSGHIIFLRHATTGDGLLTALHFFGLARRTGRTVADLAACMTRFPQVLINVEVPDREALDASEPIRQAIGAAEAALGEEGRVLVRASGTEPLVRVMVEARTEAEASTHARAIAGVVAASLGKVGTASPA